MTQIEEMILKEMMQGKGNKMIAKQMSLSHYSVTSYVYRIFKKIGVHSREELLLRLPVVNYCKKIENLDNESKSIIDNVMLGLSKKQISIELEINIPTLNAKFLDIYKKLKIEHSKYALIHYLRTPNKPKEVSHDSSRAYRRT